MLGIEDKLELLTSSVTCVTYSKKIVIGRKRQEPDVHGENSISLHQGERNYCVS